MAQRGITAPAQGAYLVTPSDTTMLTQPARAITINVAGTVSFTGPDGVNYTTDTLPIGTYPLECIRVRATGTTATGITAWV